MNEGGAVQNKSFVKIGSDFGKIMPGKRGKGMKRSILSRMAAFLLIFVLGFAVVAGNNVSTVEAAARSSSINMNIFKRKMYGLIFRICLMQAELIFPGRRS